MASVSTLTRGPAWWRSLVSKFGGNVSSADTTLVRINRPPRNPEEQRVAYLLAKLPKKTRRALIDALADDLRRADSYPFGLAPELGMWRLDLYRAAAAEAIGGLEGDLLTEQL